MQLVAYGAQDIYLTGNPQITFFKVVYRRHTNFSMEAIKQTFNGRPTTGDSDMTATISRNGDLVSRLWLECTLDRTGMGDMTTSGGANTNYTNWTNNTGHALIKECEIEIGGQKIDRHYSQWLDIWNELTDHEETEFAGLNKHNTKEGYLRLATPGTVGGGTTHAEMNTYYGSLKLYVPLQFWFCRNPGLALPLIALQYHEVKIKLKTRGVHSLVNGVGTIQLPTSPPDIQLYADYIYLDTDERRRFAQVSHEYLIEQVQRVQGAMKTAQKLNFNHPVKELIWVVQNDAVATSAPSGTEIFNVDACKNDHYHESVSSGTVTLGGDFPFKHKNDWFNYQVGYSKVRMPVSTPYSTEPGGNKVYFNGAASLEPFETMKLQLNGHDRFTARDATYFRTCQPLQAGHKMPKKHIYCYSFSLKPEEHQPSGTCNFSRIDSAKMVFTNPLNNVSNLQISNDDGTLQTNTLPFNNTLTVYAVNYNVLRIMSGMGGLAYSN